MANKLQDALADFTSSNDELLKQIGKKSVNDVKNSLDLGDDLDIDVKEDSTKEEKLEEKLEETKTEEASIETDDSIKNNTNTDINDDDDDLNLWLDDDLLSDDLDIDVEENSTKKEKLEETKAANDIDNDGSISNNTNDSNIDNTNDIEDTLDIDGLDKDKTKTTDKTTNTPSKTEEIKDTNTDIDDDDDLDFWFDNDLVDDTELVDELKVEETEATNNKVVDTNNDSLGDDDNLLDFGDDLTETKNTTDNLNSDSVLDDDDDDIKIGGNLGDDLLDIEEENTVVTPPAESVVDTQANEDIANFNETKLKEDDIDEKYREDFENNKPEWKIVDTQEENVWQNLNKELSLDTGEETKSTAKNSIIIEEKVVLKEEDSKIMWILKTQLPFLYNLIKKNQKGKDKDKWNSDTNSGGATTNTTTNDWKPQEEETDESLRLASKRRNLDEIELLSTKKNQLFMWMNLMLLWWLVVLGYSIFYFNGNVFDNFKTLKEERARTVALTSQRNNLRENYDNLKEILENEENSELVILTPKNVEDDLIQKFYMISKSIGMDMKKEENLVVKVWLDNWVSVEITNIDEYSTMKKLVNELRKWRNYYIIDSLAISLWKGNTIKDYSYKLNLTLVPAKEIMFGKDTWSNSEDESDE